MNNKETIKDDIPHRRGSDGQNATSLLPRSLALLQERKNLKKTAHEFTLIHTSSLACRN